MPSLSTITVPAHATAWAADALEAELRRIEQRAANLGPRSDLRRRQLENRRAAIAAVALELRRAADEHVADFVARCKAADDG